MEGHGMSITKQPVLVESIDRLQKQIREKLLLWSSRILRVPVKIREEFYGVTKGCL